ncbi:MAG TPA: GNAT family N-acetyltransferase [Thermoanaerobaculia bacterium]|nr:GNAT family N-acetyltransferase [Thermoanaerobaculia bacterium]
MVSLPIDDQWAVRSLSENDRPSIFAFLEREPLLNIYLLSRLMDEGFGHPGQTIEIRHHGATVCVASLTSNLVFALDRELTPAEHNLTLDLLADRVLRGSSVPRAIIADEQCVDEIWQQLRSRIDPPTVVRLRQPVYVLESFVDDGTIEAVRFSTMDDLDALVPACAAMHREEVGIDPLERDAVGYRQRVRELILRERSLILIVDGSIAFKCEFSAVTAQAIQLMGVWTAPAHRRKGHARRGMTAVCRYIIGQGRKATLFVNDFNTPAIRLYESLGFRRIGTNRALIW